MIASLRRSLGCVLIAGLVVVSVGQRPATAHTAEAKRGMVVTGHPIATEAGVAAMRAGGNAVDAAVAAAVTLGVVDGHNSGIGGGCLMLVRLADGRVLALDGRETAPAAATRDMFVRDGKAVTKLSQTGALASGVPGSLAVYDHALRQFGKRTLADALRPAADVAEKGFELNRTYAAKLRGVADDLATFEASRQVLLKPDGTPYAQGETLKQPDLARTYRAIADDGIGHFYGGPFARAVETWMRDNGGILTADDFANYQLKQREPLRTRYRGHTIVGFPPPSSGGVHVAQVLNILERFDLKALEQENSADRLHVTTEAMKLAFADRAFWLGDPDFAKVPRGLADAGYAAELAKRIDAKGRALEGVEHGTPPRHEDDLFGRHTTHVATADAEGNWVALTATVNTAFGSKVIVPGTGVVLNNQMDDFSVQPGVPNHFGLVGGEANAVAPGKRPLSSMSPTIVLGADDAPVMTVGAAGGPRIISQVICVVSHRLDLGDDLPAAMRRPRLHHQWLPKTLWIENTTDAKVLDALKSRGHALEVVRPAGATNAIAREGDTFVGVSEPRGEGRAGGL